MLLTLNPDLAREIFAARVNDVSAFGNLCTETQKIVEYPILTENLRIKLVDCPGFRDAKEIEKVR